MNLQSPKVIVDKSDSYIFNALSDLRNFEKLMPENISKFEVLSDDVFNFGLAGMPEIKLRLKEKIANTTILLNAASDKLAFSLTANIISQSASTCEVQLLFEGEFNTMMAMMIKGPIQKFIDTLSSNMNKL